ncbi:hypothetical protein [Actinoplanes sp. L3-i22]|uniref:hypothetical protein n=1 Tax=Actinoplanes sp. L3-i22 TaxID=2836373 RepID=UPI001C74C57C|nr:hypothetical protein [Actinoplanes sp. L3-i22]BCY13055.1 hypothetical protein L3i22_081430 [Actinoplanes sp. L3-i22]
MTQLSLSDLSLAGDRSTLYLALAGICLIIGLRYLKRALEPFGAVLEAAAAAAIVAFALGVGLILLLAAIAVR